MASSGFDRQEDNAPKYQTKNPTNGMNNTDDHALVYCSWTRVVEQETSQIRGVFSLEFCRHCARSEPASVSPEMNHPESVGRAANEADFHGNFGVFLPLQP
jgi:hypothetical protein